MVFAECPTKEKSEQDAAFNALGSLRRSDTALDHEAHVFEVDAAVMKLTTRFEAREDFWDVAECNKCVWFGWVWFGFSDIIFLQRVESVPDRLAPLVGCELKEPGSLD